MTRGISKCPLIAKGVARRTWRNKYSIFLSGPIKTELNQSVAVIRIVCLVACSTSTIVGVWGVYARCGDVALVLSGSGITAAAASGDSTTGEQQRRNKE